MNEITIKSNNKKQSISRGQIYMLYDTPYIVACLGDDYALISLVDGNRFANPSDINSIWGMTGKEQFELVDGTVTIETNAK